MYGQIPRKVFVELKDIGTISWPSQLPPTRNKGLLGGYWPSASLNKALLNPCFWGGGSFDGGSWEGHEICGDLWGYESSHVSYFMVGLLYSVYRRNVIS